MGSGGGSYFPRAKPDLERLIIQAKKDADRERLDGDVNKLLRIVLSSYERDPEKVNQYMAEITDVLKEEADIEQFLFGGSVAKHTYVDGLSDIDALIISNREDLAGKSPRTVLNAFHKILQDKLFADKVESIAKGSLAITVTYRDGTEIQLLPAIRVGAQVAIKDIGGGNWKKINPSVFQHKLSKANQRLNNALVPTIKLVKSINSGLPKQKQLESSHIECLAVDVVKNYRGPATPKALIQHFFSEAPKRVLNPIQDITGQSRTIDSYLGRSNSTKRRIAADALAGIARRLNSAVSVDQWKKIIED